MLVRVFGILRCAAFCSYLIYLVSVSPHALSFSFVAGLVVCMVCPSSSVGRVWAGPGRAVAGGSSNVRAICASRARGAHVRAPCRDATLE
eukprot:scaffold20106_cov111-Isochrysis_galbana.AAC.3